MVTGRRLLALALIVASTAAFTVLLPHRTPAQTLGPQLGAHDLAPLRAAAGGDVEVLAVSRDAPHRALGFAEADGRLFATIPGAAVSRHGADAQLALVAVDARPPSRANPGFSQFPLYLLGVVRSDVTRVVLTAPGFDPWTVYERTDGSVGTFEPAIGLTYGYGMYADSSKRAQEAHAGLVPRAPWQARLTFFGRHGRLATLRLRYAQPGARLVTVR
jgi:hypothetical protein